MTDLRLRGYVTPEDFSGSDAEKLQQALNYAAESDIRRVVLTGTYHADTALIVPANMHLVLDGAQLYADLENEKICNYSFEQDRIYIQGKDSKITGNLSFYHARHVILEDLQIDGNADLAFSRDLRMEHLTVTGTLTLGRGCANVIAQHLQLGAVVLSSEACCQDIPGREPTVRNILLRDNSIRGGVQLTAAEDFGLLNIQIDHCNAEYVTVGKPGQVQPEQLYTNFTLTDLTLQDGVTIHTPCRNGHIIP